MTGLAVLKNGASWMYKAGVAFIVLIAAAGDGVAHLPIAPRARTLHLVVFATIPAHDIPLCSGAVLIDDCVLHAFGVGGDMEGVQVGYQQAGSQ